MARDENIEKQPVGYAALIERYRLDVPPPRHLSTISPSARRRTITQEGVHESFPEQFLRDTSDVGQLVFALKYDGVDLLVLRRAFIATGPGPLTKALRERPSSTYLRRLWFFYELLLEQALDVDDVKAGAYVDALDPEAYVTRVGPKLKRYRINFNLLGVTTRWCPIVRRTDRLRHYERLRLHELARSAVRELTPRDLERAVHYLYTKETRASFEIERTTPTTRMERFVETLFAHTAQPLGPLSWQEHELVEIAGLIVGDARFAPTGYRTNEVRVSEQRSLAAAERVHFVGARAVDVPALMKGWSEAWWAHHNVALPHVVAGASVGPDGKPYGIRFSSGDPFVDFVVAGCLSFGFVFIHPFTDGNGRLHRLLLHRVLAVTAFTPPGLVIPTSAAILHDRGGYDAALEDFSRRMMPFVDYTIDREGALLVHNDTADLYRYPDLTAQIEALCGWFESAVRTELVDEIHTLRAIDLAREAMREVVELPDQRENLFLRLCMQSFQSGNGYRVSKSKRSLFEDLTDAEVAGLEAAVEASFAAARSTGSS